MNRSACLRGLCRSRCWRGSLRLCLRLGLRLCLCDAGCGDDEQEAECQQSGQWQSSPLLFLRWCRVFVVRSAWATASGAASIRIDNGKNRGDKISILERAARRDGVTYFDVCQRDAVTMFAEGGVLVDGNGLRFLIRAVDGER